MYGPARAGAEAAAVGCLGLTEVADEATVGGSASDSSKRSAVWESSKGSGGSSRQAAGGLGVVEAAGDATLGDLRLVEVADDAEVSCGCCLEPTEPVIEGTTAGDRAAALTAGEAALTLTEPGAEVADGVTWRDRRPRPDGLRIAAELLLAIEVEVEVEGEDLVGALDEEEERLRRARRSARRRWSRIAVPAASGSTRKASKSAPRRRRAGARATGAQSPLPPSPSTPASSGGSSRTLPSELLQLIRTRSR